VGLTERRFERVENVMNRFVSPLLESVCVLAVATAIGFAVNAANPDGITIDRDHFFATSRPAIAPPSPPVAPADGTDPAARTDASDPEASIRERLASLGLSWIAHEQVLADFDDELYQKYDAYMFVDARNEANYRDGHIPGAWHFDPYHVERYANTVAPQAQGSPKVIIYCNGGACVDSENAAQRLINLGVPKEQVFIYIGGIQAWKKAGRAVEKGERKSGELVTEPAHGG
jgi:rhodanese-related sulfurtransferase